MKRRMGRAGEIVAAGVLGVLCVGVPAGANGVGTTAISAKTVPPSYVALGDSYSSGEANPPFVSPNYGCDVSQNTSWPITTATYLKASSYHDIACSGAEIVDITQPWAARQQWQAQTTQLAGFNPTVATVTIGGNSMIEGASPNTDWGFAEILQDCYGTGILWTGCAADGTLAKAESAVTDTSSTGLRARLTAAYEAIMAASPGTKLLVVGYPDIFPPQYSASTALHCAWLGPNDITGLNQIATDLNATVQAAALAAGVPFVSTLNVMSKHTLCTAKSYIESITITSGLAASAGHPLPKGQQAIAKVVGPTLLTLAKTGGGGSQWESLAPATSPSARADLDMAYDPATKQLILFGGGQSSPIGGSYNNDSWKWSGSTWVQLFPVTFPGARSNASMAYDPATKQLVLYGGFGPGLSLLQDTWVWNGITWKHVLTANSPPARHDASLGYDPISKQLILFGGSTVFDGTAMAADTWAWTGTTWTQLQPTTTPPARCDAAMAWDSTTNQLILFGGTADGLGTPMDDTWAWNGIDWAQLSPVTSPPNRFREAMSMDPATNQLVIFGGYTSGYKNLGDTWAWTGSTWNQIGGTSSPGVRSDSGLGYDPVSDHLILFGGSTGGGTNLLDDTSRF